MALADLAAALTDIPWSDIQKAAKTAMVSAALGGSNLTVNGKTIGRITEQEAIRLYNFATQQVADESTDAGSGIALVQYGERV